jgi:hypothetical protein
VWAKFRFSMLNSKLVGSGNLSPPLRKAVYTSVHGHTEAPPRRNEPRGSGGYPPQEESHTKPSYQCVFVLRVCSSFGRNIGNDAFRRKPEFENSQINLKGLLMLTCDLLHMTNNIRTFPKDGQCPNQGECRLRLRRRP